MTNPTTTAADGTDVLIAADGTEIVGRYYEVSCLFRANGDTPADGLFVVHHFTDDGRLLLDRDLYSDEVRATFTPKGNLARWAR